ncbi:MAG: hypothetical protein LBU34_14850 [Planctomycetaceae bacterium]|nr:hypothetical protein [Planctomycetaceae bacterium]
MCITVGGAKRNLRIGTPTQQSPAWGEIMAVLANNLVPAGLLFFGDVIRRLRFASPPVMHISPCGLRTKKHSAE